MTLSVKVQLCPRPNPPFHPVRQLLVKSRRGETLQVDNSFDKLAFHPVFEEMTTYETNDLKDWKEFGGEKGRMCTDKPRLCSLKHNHTMKIIRW